MIQKFIHITLAFTVLLSSMGFVVNIHYCKDELYSISLFKQERECQKEVQHPSNCPFHPQEEQEQPYKDCCHDRTMMVRLIAPQQAQSFELQSPVDLLNFGLIALALKLELPETTVFATPSLNYKPPLLVWDLPISLQVFRC